MQHALLARLGFSRRWLSRLGAVASVNSGAPIDGRDGNRRTPLHVAAFAHKIEAARELMRLGADPNALDAQRYDIVTIAAVANDVPMLKTALSGGGKAANITSPFDGTALIAAAHLGPRRGRAHVNCGRRADRSCQ